MTPGPAPIDGYNRILTLLLQQERKRREGAGDHADLKRAMADVSRRLGKLELDLEPILQEREDRLAVERERAKRGRSWLRLGTLLTLIAGAAAALDQLLSHWLHGGH